MKVISIIVIMSVPDEGYFNLLIMSVPDEGYFNLLIRIATLFNMQGLA
jgi:hypothetical protein